MSSNTKKLDVTLRRVKNTKNVKQVQQNTKPKSAKQARHKPKIKNTVTDDVKKQSLSFVKALLDAERPIRLPRPIPARTYPIVKTGEILFTTTKDYLMVQARPDPFNLFEISSEASTQNIPVANYLQNFATLLADDQQETLLSGAARIMAWSGNFQVSDTVTVATIHKYSPAGQIWQTEINGRATEGYYGLTGVTTVGSWNNLLTNKSSRAVNARGGWAILSVDNVLLTGPTFGLTTAVGANSTVALNFAAVPASVPANAALTWLLEITPTGGNVMLTDFVWALQVSTAMITTSAPIVEHFTIGRAIYPNDMILANKMDTAFAGCFLWAPAAMSVTINTTQVLKDAGGRFQASFMPSYIDGYIGEDYAKTWSSIQAFKNSYPVAQSNFERGTHGSWLGQRIEDYAFKRPIDPEQVDTIQNGLPRLIFIANKASDTSSITYRIDFAVNIEIQTVDPNYTMGLGPGSPDVMAFCLSLLADNHDLVGCNPDHIQRILKLAKRVAGNPVFQSAVKTLLMTGIALI